MPKALVNTKEREEQLLNEYQAMQLLSSPFCVHLHAAFQNRDALFFLMDYVGGVLLTLSFSCRPLHL